MSISMAMVHIRTRLRRGTRLRWVLARALVCLGAALFLLANLLTWVTITFTFVAGSQPTGPEGGPAAITESLSGTMMPTVLALRLAMDRGAAAFSYLRWVEWGWYGIPVVALLLALLLWQRASARLALLTLWVFRGWLVAMTLLGLASMWQTFDMASLIQSRESIRVVSTELGAGFWLALAALGLLWVGVALMLGEPRLPARASRLLEPRAWRRSPAQLAGLGLVLVGVLLWGLGYIALPWATVNCPPRLSLTHYVDGVCGGLDSGDTLMAYVSPHLSGTASPYAPNALLLAFVLVFASALLLVAGASRHTYTRGFCGWVLAWLIAATGMALLSYRGVSSVVSNPPFALGAWQGSVGIVLTFAGLLCTWASLIPLEAAGLARAAMEVAIAGEGARVAARAQTPR